MSGLGATNVLLRSMLRSFKKGVSNFLLRNLLRLRLARIDSSKNKTRLLSFAEEDANILSSQNRLKACVLKNSPQKSLSPVLPPPLLSWMRRNPGKSKHGSGYGWDAEGKMRKGL